MYKIVRSNGDMAHDITEFIVDSVEDIKTLPGYVSMGSKVYVIDSGELYIKNGKNEWKYVPTTNGSGSGSGPGSDDSYIPISTDSINSLFKE